LNTLTSFAPALAVAANALSGLNAIDCGLVPVAIGEPDTS
jgi:hypothetical protein